MTFLKNAWYAAANASEFSEDGMVARLICNEPVVMYRKSTGELAAIQDRCPHRFVPLSMGNRLGDNIQCGYHGLQFDGTGACVAKPFEHGAERPDIFVKAYPIVERHATAWLWLGDPARADPSTIPDFSFLHEDDTLTAVISYSRIKANYLAIADNLLDLSHTHILHNVHSGSDYAGFKNEVKRNNDEIWSMLWRPHYHVDERRRSLYGFERNDVEGQGHTRWTAPGNLAVYTGWWDHGKSLDEGVRAYSSHLLTPETETTTHYFWGVVRNYARDNDDFSQNLEAQVRGIFETEDGPMLEAQQRAMGNEDDIFKLRPTILKADTAGVMVRREMKRRLREENENSDETARAGELVTAAE